MPEGLSAAEVGKEIAEHREEATAHHVRRDRLISIFEAVLLSLVALLAAWSGYSAAKVGHGLVDLPGRCVVGADQG